MVVNSDVKQAGLRHEREMSARRSLRRSAKPSKYNIYTKIKTRVQNCPGITILVSYGDCHDVSPGVGDGVNRGVSPGVDHGVRLSVGQRNGHGDGHGVSHCVIHGVSHVVSLWVSRAQSLLSLLKFEMFTHQW